MVETTENRFMLVTDGREKEVIYPQPVKIPSVNLSPQHWKSNELNRIFPKFSSDGRYIFYTVGAQALAIERTGFPTIKRIDLKDGKSEFLLLPQSGGLVFNDITKSQSLLDGKFYIFSDRVYGGRLAEKNKLEKPLVYFFDPETQKLDILMSYKTLGLTDRVHYVPHHEIVASADGKRIVFLLNERLSRDKPAKLGLMLWQEGEVRLLLDLDQLGSTVIPTAIAFSGDGTKVALINKEANETLWLFDITTGTIREIPLQKTLRLSVTEASKR